jgi:ubiquitin-protein ligase
MAKKPHRRKSGDAGQREERKPRPAGASKPASDQKAASQAAPQAEGTIRVLFVEDTTGEQFECRVPVGTSINHLAGDFFESQGWDTHDARGRAQRAVVELVDRDNPDRTLRLNGDDTVEGAGLQDNDVLRVFPESVAGAVDERARLPALIQDLNGMTDLAGWNKRITFEAKPAQAPTFYRVRLDYPGFRRLDRDEPVRTETHEVEIHLGARYPAEAPRVFWASDVFHPNIHPEHRGVCLGVLMERWMPGMGVARLVTMLAEIAQWRNFDIINAFNPEAARWASDPANMEYVRQIGGSPEQHPIGELWKLLEKGSQAREPIAFSRVGERRQP